MNDEVFKFAATFKEVPITTTERAYTSPIWYAPAANKRVPSRVTATISFIQNP